MAGVRQFDEEKVLAAALEVFRRKGLGETSMQDLSDAAGVQRGSLYHAYRSKDAIFLKAFELYAARFLAAARAALGGEDARAALDAFLAVAIDNMTAGSPARGCLTTRTALEAQLTRAVRGRLIELLDALGDEVEAALLRSGASLAMDAASAARLVVALTRGLAVMERVGTPRAELEATAQSLVDLLLAPAAAPGGSRRTHASLKGGRAPNSGGTRRSRRS